MIVSGRFPRTRLLARVDGSPFWRHNFALSVTPDRPNEAGRSISARSQDWLRRLFTTSISGKVTPARPLPGAVYGHFIVSA